MMNKRTDGNLASKQMFPENQEQKIERRLS